MKKEKLERAVQRVKEEKKSSTRSWKNSLQFIRGSLWTFHVFWKMKPQPKKLWEICSKTKAEAWYLLTAQSCNKVVGKEEISQHFGDIQKSKGKREALIFIERMNLFW